jgi:hypothetical protein
MLAIAAVFAQIEKKRLVRKLRVARERKRKAAGKCEGRKSWAELRPDLVQQVKRLRRKSPSKGGQSSLREISAELAKLGFLNGRTRPFSASSIALMLESNLLLLCAVNPLRHDPDLFQESKNVLFRPFLSELAVCDSMNSD